MHSDGHYIKEILASGSEKAIFSLVKKYEKSIFNLCFRIVKDREVAEEIAQDAFLKSFKQLKKLDDFTKYEIWLNRIAYHSSLDIIRKKKRYFKELDEIDLVNETPKSNHLLEQMDRVNAIEHALGEIPAPDAGLITLFYINELNVKEVAEVTKLTESNVKVKLMRIRKQLKELLNKNMGEEVYELY